MKNKTRDINIAILTLLFLTACTQTKSSALTINDISYKLQDAHLIQLTQDTDNTEIIAVFSDIHGHTDNFKLLLEQAKNADTIIILGDIAEHYREKVNWELTDYDEIYGALEIAADTDKPVFVIPGNHELKETYYKAIADLNRSNIIDMSTVRTFDGDDFDIISNPYGDDFTYSTDSFKGTEEQLNTITTLIANINKDDSPDILITHMPPKGSSKDDIDVIFSGENVGSEQLNRLITENSINFVFSGHIHEAGARAATIEGALKANKFSDNMRLNPGSVMPWKYLDNMTRKASAALVTVKGNEMMYETIRLP